jgi:hypothetical protein
LLREDPVACHRVPGEVDEGARGDRKFGAVIYYIR